MNTEKEKIGQLFDEKMQDLHYEDDTAQPASACRYFPQKECDDLCEAVGCGSQGLLFNMRESGVPDSELGAYQPEEPERDSNQPDVTD